MLQLKFNPFPVLETARLKLRRIAIPDAENFFILRSNLEAMKYIERPLPGSIDDIYQLIQKIENGIEKNEAIGWGITLLEDTKLIGSIGYHRIEPEHYRAEIGYMLHPSCWNKGYMNEAIEKVIDYGFTQMKLHSIEAKINPENLASAHLLTKNHFIKEAFFRENYFFNGKFLDTAVYSLLKS